MKGIIKVKDIVVLAVCVLIYIGLFMLFISPAGKQLFDTLQGWLPFMNLVDGTLTDINKAFGIVFEWLGLEESPLRILEKTYPNITPVSLVQDMSKLLLSGMIQSLLFTIVSFVFLRAGDLTPAWMEYVTSPIYAVNHFLLQGLTLLAGGLCGSFLITIFAQALKEQSTMVQLGVSAAVFAVLYILFSVYFTLKSKWADSRNSALGVAASSIARHSFSFGRSLVKTLMCNIIPELLTCYVTNIVIVVVFYIFMQWGFHIFSLAALVILIGWGCTSDAISVLLTTITEKLPLPIIGKYCPISGLLWLPATLSMMAIIGIGSAYTLAQPGSSWVEKAMIGIPFTVEWWTGASVWELLVSDLAGHFGEIIHVFLLCTLMALLQYVSSSYLATLFTQVVGRIMIVMGLMLVFFALGNLFGGLLAEVIKQSITLIYITGFLAAVVVALLFMLQPYLMLQGVATTILFFVLMHLIPGMAVNGEDLGMADRYLGAELILIGTNLLFSLLQNIASFFEKKVRKAAAAATGGLLG